MSKTFTHLGSEWEAIGAGWGTGVGVGVPPAVSQWLVYFTRGTEPSRQYWNHISEVDPHDVGEDELRRSLERALILDFLERADDWATIAEIEEATAIPAETILHRISGMQHKINQEFTIHEKAPQRFGIRTRPDGET